MAMFHFLQGRLVAAFDGTYMVQVRSMSQGKLIGGAWTPANPQNAQLQITDDLNIRNVKKCSDMCLGYFAEVFGGGC